MTTRVVFRADKTGEHKGEITAIMPESESNYGRCVCYAHIGQHSECSRDWYTGTRRASPAEYSALLKELTAIYGPIVVRTRIPSEAWIKR